MGKKGQKQLDIAIEQRNKSLRLYWKARIKTV